MAPRHERPRHRHRPDHSLRYVASVVGLAILLGAGAACGTVSATNTASEQGNTPTSITTAVDERSLVAERDGRPAEVAPDPSGRTDELRLDGPVLRRSTSSSSSSSSTTRASSTTETTMPASTVPATKPVKPLVLSTKHPPTGPGVPPIPSFTMGPEEAEYFRCVVFRESSGNPSAINSSSGAAGLYQFMQTTWDMVAARIGRGDLIGVNPALAPVDMQSYFAHVLFLWQGTQPWVSDGCVLPKATTTTTTTMPVTVPTWSVTTTSTTPGA